jgi:hypothetical protein
MSPSIKFHGNPSSGCRFDRYRWMDMRQLIGSFSTMPMRLKFTQYVIKYLWKEIYVIDGRLCSCR